MALLENSAGVKSNANFKVNVTVAYAPKTKQKIFKILFSLNNPFSKSMANPRQLVRFQIK